MNRKQVRARDLMAIAQPEVIRRKAIAAGERTKVFRGVMRCIARPFRGEGFSAARAPGLKA